jgi:hypothetical protein
MRVTLSSLSKVVSAVMSIKFRQSEKNVSAQRLTNVNVTTADEG